jgi:hypothetical protein
MGVVLLSDSIQLLGADPFVNHAGGKTNFVHVAVVSSRTETRGKQRRAHSRAWATIVGLLEYWSTGSWQCAGLCCCLFLHLLDNLHQYSAFGKHKLLSLGERLWRNLGLGVRNRLTYLFRARLFGCNLLGSHFLNFVQK